jgi:signal transduction histidine kinase
VDNAGKYARSAPDRRIGLECRADDASVRLLVSDRGPGLGHRERRRLFRPFHKSARDAAQSAPGVGLGLALSRRLARAMGGDLEIVESGPQGTCIGLRLLRASPPRDT